MMWRTPDHRNVEDVRIQCHADELMCMIWCIMSQAFEYNRYSQVHCYMHHILIKIYKIAWPLLPCCWGSCLGLSATFPMVGLPMEVWMCWNHFHWATGYASDMQYQNQLPSQSTCNVSKRPAKWVQREEMKENPHNNLLRNLFLKSNLKHC